MEKRLYKTILIIEDNPGDQLLLHENLLSTNLLIADVTIVDTLTEGINYLSRKNFSLIFLDLFLPDSSGLESFKELIKIKPAIPVIIYSGLSDTKIALNAITLGAQDFLIKGDYTLSLLEKTVRYSIERKKNLDALQISNTRFSLISKATHDMIWDWDLITGEVYRNIEGWQKIFKSKNGEEDGTIEDWSSRVHPEDRKKIEHILKELISSDSEELFEVEFRIIREDKTIGFIKDRGYIIRDGKGKAIRLMGASHDITERKNAEEKV
ncbi:MAG: response regulator [Chitinophagaceae bacterium]|nr:response regulator [Chitinophagaceae bacterium]